MSTTARTRAPDDHGRRGMLETFRVFAHARLAQRPDAFSRRHCEHYVAVAEHPQPELERSSSHGW
jgi:hypothetical protein